MESLRLFDCPALGVPATEGIKYAGSKLGLMPHILGLIEQVGPRSVLDGFSGSTRVSQALAQRGYRVISNDTAAWSEVLGTCYLLNREPRDHYQALIEHLDHVPPVDGWFTEHYGGQANGGCAVQADGLKKPFQIHNTRKLDGIRSEIENLALDHVAKAVALTSLMLALDQVDNTLGHFASYLRQWSPRSYKELTLTVPNLRGSTQDHAVFRRDIIDLASEVSVDLAYFDPPYGSNNEKMPSSRVRYAAYYHFWTSACLFDRGYAPFALGETDERLRAIGITDGGQLASVKPADIAAPFGADLLCYTTLEDFTFQNLGFIVRKNVKLRLKIVSASTGETLFDAEGAGKDLKVYLDREEAKQAFLINSAAKLVQNMLKHPLWPQTEKALDRIFDRMPQR